MLSSGQNKLKRQRQIKLLEWIRDKLPDRSNTALTRYLNWRLAQAGSRDEISKMAISRWFAGDQLIRRDSLRKLALALNCTPEDLDRYLNGQLGREFLVALPEIPTSYKGEESLFDPVEVIELKVDLTNDRAILEAILKLNKFLTNDGLISVVNLLHESLEYRLKEAGFISGTYQLKEISSQTVGNKTQYTTTIKEILDLEMQNRSLRLDKSGWQKLSQNSMISASRLEAIAAGECPSYLDLVAIEPLLEFATKPDGAKWNQSDLEAVVIQEFGELGALANFRESEECETLESSV